MIMVIIMNFNAFNHGGREKDEKDNRLTVISLSFPSLSSMIVWTGMISSYNRPSALALAALSKKDNEGLLLTKSIKETLHLLKKN